MSRIGKQPIVLPKGVTLHKREEGVFTVKGPKGELDVRPIPDIDVDVSDSTVVMRVARSSKRSAALWGLARALFANAVMGVSAGFEKKLQIEGIGFRGEVKSSSIVFNLGFSHPVDFPLPDGIAAKIEKNIITLSGIDKALVGETAARIRALKRPEPYKGKGIRYIDEVIKIKAGKKAVATTT